MKTSPKTTRLSPLALLVAIALAGSFLVTTSALAATQTWKVNNANWDDASSWNTAVPAAGDTAILTAGSGTRAASITNTNGTAAIQNLTTSNNFAWIVRSNSLNFTNNATITSGTGGSSSLTIDSTIHASGDLTVSGIKNVFNSSANTIGGNLILDGSSRLYLTGGAGSAGGANTIQFTGNNHKYLYVNGDTYTNNLALNGTGGTITAIEANTNGGTITLAGNITGGVSGMGDFAIGALNDDTTYILSGSNNYGANTVIGAVGATNTTIRITTGNAFGTASLIRDVSFRAGTNQTLELVGGIAVSNRTLYLGGSGQGVGDKGGLQTISGSNAWNGNIVLNTATNGVGGGWIGTATNSSLHVSGIISSSNGITKLGAGALIVSGANTYTGGTTVSEGSLLVENVSGSGTGTGNVSVASGAAIGGDGTISGSLSLASGAKFVFDINKTLTVSGSVSLDSSFGIASLIGLDNTTPDGTYTLINGTSTDFLLLGLQNWGAANAYDLGGGQSAYFQQGSLQVKVVPEPGTLALLGLGSVLGLALLRRRK